MTDAKAVQPPGLPGRSPGLDAWLGRPHAGSSTMAQHQSINSASIAARDHYGLIQASDDENDGDEDEIATSSRSTTVTPSQQLRVTLSPLHQPSLPSFSERHARTFHITKHDRPLREEKEREDGMNDVDELAGDDESLPLIMSDLDPKYRPSSESEIPTQIQTDAQTPQKHRQQQQQQQQQQEQLAVSPQLSIRTSQKHGFSTSTIPAPQSYNTQVAPSTSNRSVSVSIPSLSPAAAALVASDIATASSTKKASPVVAVGRRSSAAGAGAGVKTKGRPKGWKPGMSYREAALRNMGMDGDEAAAAAAAMLLPPPKKRRTGAGTDGDEQPKQQRGRRGRRGRPHDTTTTRKPTPDHNSIYRYRRPGRPPLQTIESIQRSIFVKSPITYIPFLCEWAGCRAELQNMATLRKHVRVVHGQATSCQWRRCANRVSAVVFRREEDTDEEDDLDSKRGRTHDDHSHNHKHHKHDHKHNESFTEHMEYHHLVPLQWHQGDGFVNNSHLGTLVIPPPRPRAKPSMATTDDDDKNNSNNNNNNAHADHADNDADGSTSEKLPRYLLDEDGRQVTPLIRDPQLQSAVFSWTHEERVRRLKDLYRQQQQQQNRRPDRGWSRFL